MRPHTNRLSTVSLVLALLIVMGSFQFAAARNEPSRTSEQGERPGEKASGYPSLTWRFETESQITDTPVLAGDTLLVYSEDGYLYALDEATGELRWRRDTGHGPFLRAEFAVSGDSVFVADTTGNLIALDIVSGRERWSRTASQSDESQIFSPPTVLDGVVYVDDIEGEFGNVYALDAGTGDLLWQAQVGRMPAYALPVADGTVVVTDIDGHVWFVNAETGELRASYDTGNILETSPTVVEGVAYITAAGGKIDAIDIATAQPTWSVDLPIETESTPNVRGVIGDVLIASADDRLFGVSTIDGALQWEFASVYFPFPTVYESDVYALDPEYRLTSLDVESGAPRWTLDRQASHVRVVDDLLYASVGQSVFGVDRETGVELWRVRTGGLVRAPALVSGSSIYIASTDHFLYGLDRGDESAAPEALADLPRDVEIDPLLTIRLEALPATPAFAGLWRATVQAVEDGTVPPFGGPAVALVRGGSLSSSDGFVVGLGLEITVESETVEDGDSFFLPMSGQLEFENEGDTAVELLIVGILPADAALPVSERRGPQLELLGGDEIDLLPGDGAFIELHRLTVDAGSTLLPTLSVWPDLLVVVDGSVDIAAEGGASVTTYEKRDSVAMEIGVTRFIQAGDAGPATLLVLEIDGNIHIGQGAGCGGRCLTPRSS